MGNRVKRNTFNKDLVRKIYGYLNERSYFYNIKFKNVPGTHVDKEQTLNLANLMGLNTKTKIPNIDLVVELKENEYKVLLEDVDNLYLELKVLDNKYKGYCDVCIVHDNYEIDDLNFLFTDCFRQEEPEVAKMNVEETHKYYKQKLHKHNFIDQEYILGYNQFIKKIDLSGINFNENIKCMIGTFANLYGLEEVIFGETAHNMKLECILGAFIYVGLDTIDIRNLDLSNLKYIGWFCTDSKISKILINKDETFENLEVVNNLCAGCINLRKIDLREYTKLNTKKLRDIQGMFTWCHDLEYVNLENLTVDNVENADKVFYNNQSLKQLHISNWKFKKLKTADEMFCMCKNLKTLELPDLSSGTLESIDNMFELMDNLESLSLDGVNLLNLKQYYTSTCSYMKLKTLDLTNCKVKNYVIEDLISKNKFKYIGRIIVDNKELYDIFKDNIKSKDTEIIYKE